MWGGAMLLSAVAAVVGGTDHGFRAYYGPTTRYWVWEVVYVAIGGANALLLAGAAHVVLDPSRRVYAYGALGARCVGFVYRVSRDQGFHHVVSHYALTLVLLLAFAAWGAWRRERWAGWLGGAILVSVAGAAVQGLRLAPHPHFNHNDLFHVLQTAGVVCFSRAAELFPARLERALTWERP